MDKVVVSNKRALTGKYTADGLAKIEAAISRLAAADNARGIKTGRIYIDAADDMADVGDSVINTQDETGAKEAIDAIAHKFNPDYLVLLGGPDIVPHIGLDNPTPRDGDSHVPSDLPYASSAPHSRNIEDFLDAGRVVSRIPAPAGDNPGFLTRLLDQSSAHASRPVADYASYFAISADAWTDSTQMSLNQIFGNFNDLKLAPPATHTDIDADLAKRAHFINCHGRALRPKFFGEKNGQKPVSIEGSKLAGNIEPDTVVAAECCYGADMYDHLLAGSGLPICLSYLENGAIGFVGSTNISYGPAEAIGAADLLAQFFWINLLKGQSLGRAFLQARQDFVRRERMSDPANLKTIGQFILLGDASVHPCSLPAHVAASAGVGVVDATMQRKAVRLALVSNGQSVMESASKMGKLVTSRSRLAGHADLLEKVRGLAGQRGLEKPDVASYRVSGGRVFMSSVKSLAAKPLVTVAIETTRNEDGVPEVRLLVAHSLREDGDIAISSLRTYVSR
ncbi:C25 family cysteine peptidase (plasmid) [Bradyrhizobium septentrionale]|uniref:Gingipain domain-containing protein n=1 Tax=Bradyrhizobium septentrionale TaxID=1404411 RepID=A0A973WB04_9BRAD|nr:C25 family cysteine peptidase [Bradyrhizobium septentrionale]UGY11957.1 C25 family cysteine peptidase [Bradyrhizobium septentrionale]UGY30158.1 C25 family cysteine peptidase [Bradyrhizobium septentrionale]